MSQVTQFTFFIHALINGRVRKYDMAGRRNDYRELEKAGKIVYLGKGVIYKISGKKQNPTRQTHFWRRTKKSAWY